MYCPICATTLLRIDQGNPIEEYKALYQDWQQKKAGPPPPLPNESIRFTCPKGCFSEASPLVMHHASGEKYLPREDSWSLTFKGEPLSIPGV